MTSRTTAARASRPLLGSMVVAMVSALVLAGCVTNPVEPTTSESPSASTAPSASPSIAPQCNNATVSYAPQDTSAYATAINKRGYLLVGVSADTKLLGAVNPQKPSEFEGFDIDMARLVAKAIFGDATKIRFKVITTADRISQLQEDVNPQSNAEGGVDLVARAFTMNCDRWNRLAFSQVYFLAHQGLLVRTGSPVDSVAKLAGRTVCAPKGSTSLVNIAKVAPQAKTQGVAAHTDCLVLLQEGAVDAVTGDDAILAGFKVQDPGTSVLPKVELSNEPYGLGVPLKHKDFAAYINKVLEQARTDGSWQQAYNAWLAPALGPGTQPAGQHGRT